MPLSTSSRPPSRSLSLPRRCRRLRLRSYYTDNLQWCIAGSAPDTPCMKNSSNLGTPGCLEQPIRRSSGVSLRSYYTDNLQWCIAGSAPDTPCMKNSSNLGTPGCLEQSIRHSSGVSLCTMLQRRRCNGIGMLPYGWPTVGEYDVTFRPEVQYTKVRRGVNDSVFRISIIDARTINSLISLA